MLGQNPTVWRNPNSLAHGSRNVQGIIVFPNIGLIKPDSPVHPKGGNGAELTFEGPLRMTGVRQVWVPQPLFLFPQGSEARGPRGTPVPLTH